jgi:hypothetical protein
MTQTGRTHLPRSVRGCWSAILPMSGCPPKIGALLPLQPAQAPLKSSRRRRCRGMYEPQLVDDPPGAVDSKHRQTVAVPVTSV